MDSKESKENMGYLVEKLNDEEKLGLNETIKIYDPDANIFMLLAKVTDLLVVKGRVVCKEKFYKDLSNEMITRTVGQKSYKDAIKIINEYCKVEVIQ